MLKIWKNLINKYKKKTNLILEAFDQESYYFCRKFKKDVDLKISTSEVDNYLNKYQCYDLHGSYVVNYRDFDISIAVVGQNIGDNSQVLDGLSIFDKRIK